MFRETAFRLSCALFCLIGFAQGQASSPAGKPTRPSDFSQEAAVVEKIGTVIHFQNDGTSTTDHTLRVKIQTAAGAQQFGLLSFDYLRDAEKLEFLTVRVTKPDGTVVNTPPTSIEDIPAEVSVDTPFFTDLRKKHVPVRSLSPGDVLEYEVRETLVKPLIPNQFWYAHNFTDSAIVLSEELQFDVPSGRSMIVKSEKLKPTVSEQNGRTIYTWKTSHLQTGKKDPPVLAGRLPISDVQATTFKDWGELAQWAAELYKDRVVATPDLRAKALELTKNAKTDEEKARALYDFVSLRFRYIGVALGPARWQPHPASEVFRNQFGDCKDKHALLAALLGAVGITAYPALVNTAQLLDEDVPSPIQFNHVITYIPGAKGATWLDTTMEVAPYGWITYVMGDKPALVVDPAHAAIKRVPSHNGGNEEEFNAEAVLNSDGTLTAKIERILEGDSAILVRSLYRRVGPASYRDLTQKISYGTGFGGTVSDVTTSDVEDTSKPFKITYNYERKNYPDWDNHRITTFLGPILLPRRSDEPDDKDNPILLGSPGEIRSNSRMKLPTDFTPVLPKNVDLKRDFAEYHSRCNEDEPGFMSCDRTIRVMAPLVEVKQIESYETFRKAVSDDTDQYVVLSAKGSPEQKDVASTSSVIPQEAIDLVEQARAAYMVKDFPGTIDYMRRALKIAPNFPNGWIMLGSAQASQRDNEGALASFRKQAELDPKNAGAYRAESMLLAQSGRFEEATQPLRKLLEVDPDSRETVMNLASMEIQLKRYDAAIKEYERFIEKHPDDSMLGVALGLAHVKAGDKDKGFQTIRASIKEDTEPALLNDAAYMLAEESMNLADAQSWAERAVAREEARAVGVKLDQASYLDFSHSLTLAAYWDTLGWVYYRQANYPMAEEYLRSAWILSQSSVNAVHLAKVYEAQKKTTLAMKMYAFAVADGSKDPQAETNLRKLAATRSIANRMISEARNGLSNLRTAKMTWTPRTNLSSEFVILLSNGPKVEDIWISKPVGNRDQLAKSLASIKFNQPFPNGSNARIVRKGIVFCSGGPTCDVVLLPISTATP